MVAMLVTDTGNVAHRMCMGEGGETGGGAEEEVGGGEETGGGRGDEEKWGKE